ncbi:MAG: hypothetical protein KAV00_08525 [Phycisphaerae bacterium]|nr:hypothetical protein [Phycisphaerae bacterium]
MSKTMGFRNSGKLDLGGKNMEYILAGALLLIIIVAVVLSVGGIQCGGGTAGPGGKPMFKCVECKKEWEIEPEEASKFNREMERDTGRERGDTPIGWDCPKCNKEGCVFLMIQCPKCKKYFLSKRYTDTAAFVKAGRRDICPECDTDVHEWYKEHRRR